MVGYIFCINVAFYFTGQVVPGIPLVTPFTNSTITPITPPNLYGTNATQGLVGNLTGQTFNATDKNPLTLTFNQIYWPLAAMWTFVQFVTGGFFFSAILLIGFPWPFVYGFMGIMGALLGRSLIYYATGR